MYQNPMNDFYLRQAQPYQQTFNFPPPQQPQIRANWVSSVEEAKASQIDFISTNLFLDTASGKIYLKRIGDNGKPQFITYVIEDELAEKDPLTEINSRLSNIENFLGGLNVQSVSSNQQSEPVYQSAVAKQNEFYDETKSASVQKDARNDKWKK